MRLSVMELGRFTLRGAPEASTATKLIILQARGERNAEDDLDERKEGTLEDTEVQQSPPCPVWHKFAGYFAGAVFDCLAMIRFLILL